MFPFSAPNPSLTFSSEQNWNKPLITKSTAVNISITSSMLFMSKATDYSFKLKKQMFKSESTTAHHNRKLLHLSTEGWSCCWWGTHRGTKKPAEALRATAEERMWSQSTLQVALCAEEHSTTTFTNDTCICATIPTPPAKLLLCQLKPQCDPAAVQRDLSVTAQNGFCWIHTHP